MTPIGAHFARAIALFVRYPGPLVALYAVVWVPQIVVALLVAHALPAPVVPHGTSLETMRALVQQQIAQLPYIAFVLIVAPLGNVAVIALAAGYVAGDVPAPQAALALAFRRWLPAIVVSLLGALVIAVVLACASVVLGLVSAGIILVVGSASSAAAGPITALTAGVGMLIGLALTGFVWAALGMATVTLVLEDAHPLHAARIAVGRVLDARTVRRALRVGCVYLGVQLGTAVVLDTLSWPIANVASGALAALASALGGAAVTCVLLTFLLLFTLELRVAREGADLLAAADTIADDGDRELIERFLARRDALAVGARALIAKHIADRMRPKLRASFDHLDDEALLEHLARSTF